MGYQSAQAMHLEFFVRRRGWPATQVTEESIFQNPGDKVLLVENQEEEEIMEAMQLMYGAEMPIAIIDPDKSLDYYLKLFAWVYTSWDPQDRNRI